MEHVLPRETTSGSSPGYLARNKRLPVKMNPHWKVFLTLIIVTPAFILFSGCQLSTPESRAQNVTDVASQKTITTRGEQLQPLLKLLPVDESNLDPSLQEFRNQLTIAATNHDKEFLLTVLDRKVDNGYDIEEGVAEFERLWHLDDPGSSVWYVLKTILAGGGTFNESRTEFCGPYFVSQWRTVIQQLPEGTDTLDYVAITEKDVAVRRDANKTAPVVTTLSYEVVKIISEQDLDRTVPGGSTWLKVQLANGQEGFVLDNTVGSPMDYAGCFTRKKDKWVITRFSARE